MGNRRTERKFQVQTDTFLQINDKYKYLNLFIEIVDLLDQRGNYKMGNYKRVLQRLHCILPSVFTDWKYIHCLHILLNYQRWKPVKH